MTSDGGVDFDLDLVLDLDLVVVVPDGPGGVGNDDDQPSSPHAAECPRIRRYRSELLELLFRPSAACPTRGDPRPGSRKTHPTDRLQPKYFAKSKVKELRRGRRF